VGNLWGEPGCLLGALDEGATSVSAGPGLSSGQWALWQTTFLSSGGPSTKPVCASDADRLDALLIDEWRLVAVQFSALGTG
jgi:hypothetical protein